MNNDAKEHLFYARKFHFSYSSLSKLLYSPGLFYRHYVLEEREELLSDSALEGKIIHALLLDKDIFDKEYVVSEITLPSDNVKAIVDKIYKLYQEEQNGPEDAYARTKIEEFSDEIQSIMREMNFYQKMTDKIAKLNKEGGEAYFEYLKSTQGKRIISADMYAKCVDIVNILKNSDVIKLTGLHPDNPTYEHVYNEVAIETTMDEFPFGLKGTVDNIFIDHEHKVVRINDIKTTSKTIAEFPEAVEYYKYGIQAAIYERLVKKIIIAEEYDYVFTFIVIDKYGQVYPFEVSEDTMTNWQIDLQDKLNEAKWHYETRDYSLPYSYLKKKVVL
jgi:hypothetical protein